MAGPSNEELLAQIQALGREVHALRDEVEGLKRADAAKLPLPAPPAAAPPPASLAPNVPAPAGPAHPPPARLAPAPAPVYAPRKAGPKWSFDEKFIGEKMLQYVGIVILTLGIVFFLIWTAANAGPAARVLLAVGTGATLIAAGWAAEKRPPYDKMSGALIGGGWTTVYVTAYAAGHWEATKVLSSPTTILGALFATAAGMIAHAVSRRSRPLRLYAVSLTYFLMIFCGPDLPGFEVFLILFAAAAAVAVGAGEADVLIASLVGYYANYVGVYMHTIMLAPAERTAANFVAPFLWLAIPYLIVAVLPLIPKGRRLFDGPQSKLGEAALCLNSVLFALVAGSMGRVYFGVPQLPRAAALAAFLAVPSLLYIRSLSRRSPAAGLNALLALGLLAAAVFEMPDPMWKLFAWIVVSCAWVWVGLFFDQAVWRAGGLAMAMLTFGLYWHVAGLDPESRRAASMALFLFAALAYFFSRFHRLWLSEPAPWEKSSTTLWLHAGSLALLLGLWGVLDAAPFLCVLCALAVAAEYAGQNLRRVDLWQEAVLLEYGLGAYSFFVDYGVDASVAGIPTRLWTSALVIATYAYLYLDGPVDEELAAQWPLWSRSSLRAGLTWAAAAVAAFAIYKEFDGRLRLPVWALWSLALYWVGRARREPQFLQQSVLLALFAAAEAVITYLLYPSALLSPLSAFQGVFFWLSCAALLGGLLLAKSKRWGEPGKLDAQAAAAFGFLPLALGACYLGKELDRLQLTLAWTALGLAFLIGGIACDWKELRRPALGLLGLCVAKALLSDTAHLPLPYRVVSFVALGLVLLFGSSLYVRIGAKHEKTTASNID
jgi:uncharacterized membrane protein